MKKRVKVIFCVLATALFWGCVSLRDKEIIGIAENAKGGAIVIPLSNDTPYYVDGLDYWNDCFLYKTVVVYGKLDSVSYPYDSTRIEQVILFQYILKRPRYRLLEK